MQQQSPTVSLQSRGELTVVRLGGEIDVAVAGDLKNLFANLADVGQLHLVVDLVDVTFMDSTGLGALLAARKQMLSREGSVALVSPPDAVQEVLNLTGISALFPTFESAQDAIGGELPIGPSSGRQLHTV